MGRHTASLVACLTALILGGAGCILSPQPEPPDVQDINGPDFFDDVNAYAGDGDWSCDVPECSGMAGEDCDGAYEPAPGCRDDQEEPPAHDDGGDGLDPAADELGVVTVSPDVAVVYDDDGDDPSAVVTLY